MGAYLDRLDKRVSTYLDVLGILSSISGFRRAQHRKFRHTPIYSVCKAYFDKLSKLISIFLRAVLIEPVEISTFYSSITLSVLRDLH